jgi:hypothetical protein
VAVVNMVMDFRVRKNTANSLTAWINRWFSRISLLYELVYILVETTNNMHWFIPLLYSMYWLLHVSAVACHHQGDSWVRLSYLKYKSNRCYIMCGYVACEHVTT